MAITSDFTFKFMRTSQQEINEGFPSEYIYIINDNKETTEEFDDILANAGVYQLSDGCYEFDIAEKTSIKQSLINMGFKFI